MELHKLKSTDSFINDSYALFMQYAACLTIVLRLFLGRIEALNSGLVKQQL